MLNQDEVVSSICPSCCVGHSGEAAVLQHALREVLRAEQEVACLWCQVRVQWGRLRVNVVRTSDKHPLGPGEIRLMTAGENDEPSVTRLNVGEIEEHHEWATEDLAIALLIISDGIACTPGAPFPRAVQPSWVEVLFRRRLPRWIVYLEGKST